MKRDYDYSFVNSDTQDITSAKVTRPHSLQHIATPATQQSTKFTASPVNSPRHAGLFTPTLELRVPLLPPTIGFNTDFQSNTTLRPSSLADTQFHTSAVDALSNRLTGLGIRYESPATAEISFSFGQDASLQVTPKSSGSQAISGDPCSRGDVCHGDFSPGLRLSDSELILVECYRSDGSTDVTNSAFAYSTCPIGDYMAHSPSASSVPSLSHGGSSECSLGDDSHTGSVKDNLQCLLDLYSPALGNKTPSGSDALVGIFADVNLRQLAIKYDPPELGVNPADIMGEDTCVKSETETDGSPHLCYPSFSPPERDMRIEDAKPDDAAFPDDAINVIVSVLSASKREQDLQEARLSAQSASCPPWPTIPYSGNASATPAIFSHLAAPMATQHWSFPSPARMAPPDRSSLAPIFSPQATPFVPLSQAVDRVIKPQSPILNAHMGVDLQLLRRRADDFRRTNPGIDIDKTWLQEYAGRLSERGELIEDYRCYVVGCTQRNKRKDHILVHIGSHVEHRPFQCNHCGMRFLRKNECKRHESSHGGRKPFQCSICAPVQDKSFVRQDLLKRHMRVAHGVQTESAADRRKRAKLAEDGEFWP